MMTSRHVLQTTARQCGKRSLLKSSLRVNHYASYALWKTTHANDNVDVNTAKATFFNAFDSDSSLRGQVAYTLSFASNNLSTDLASDDTFPLLNDVMMRQLLNSYSTRSTPSSYAAREMRNKLPPQLNLSNLEPFENIDAKDSLPDLNVERGTIPSGYNQPLPKTMCDLDPIKLDSENRAMVVTEIKSPFAVTQVNSAWESLCGYARDECRGKSLGRLLQGPDTEWEVVSSLLSRLLAGEEASAVITNYSKDGKRFKNFVRVGPVRDEMGKTVQFVGVLREMKEEERFDKRKEIRMAQLPFVS